MKSNFLLRQLSHGEDAFYKASLSITTMSKISGDIPYPTLQACFEILLNRYPILKYCVTENKGNRYFTNRPTEEKIVKEKVLSSEDEAHQYFQKTMNNPLNPQNSLIEMTLLTPNQHNQNARHTYVITNVSHIISDGVCNIELLRELLNLCDQGLTSQLAEHYKLASESDPGPKRSIPQAIENRLPHRPEGATVEDTVNQYLNIIKEQTHQTLHPNNLNSNNSQIEVLTQTLSADTTLTILAWCKKRSLSFNNVFTAALIMAASSVSHHRSFLVRNAVDLRSKVKPIVKPNEFITGATSILTSLTVTKDDSLESLSRKVSLSTNNALLQAPYFENHIANKEIFKLEDIPLAFHLSNVGRLNISNEFNTFSLDNIIIAPATSCGNTLPIVVTTYKNCLSITTHALKELYTQEFVQNLLSETIGLISAHKSN
jgi:hypothetical protein